MTVQTHTTIIGSEHSLPAPGSPTVAISIGLGQTFHIPVAAYWEAKAMATNARRAWFIGAWIDDSAPHTTNIAIQPAVELSPSRAYLHDLKCDLIAWIEPARSGGVA